MLSSLRFAVQSSTKGRIGSSLAGPKTASTSQRISKLTKPSLASKWTKSSFLPLHRRYTTQAPASTAPIVESSAVLSKEIVVPDSSVSTEAALTEIVLTSSHITSEAMIPVSPETIALHIWLTLQHDLGIPLWAAMAVTTWGIRTIALPIFFAQVRNMATLSLISPRIQSIKQKMAKHEASGDQVMVNYWDERLKALYKTFEASPLKNFSSAFTIVPLMIAQAVSARYMLGHTPQLLEDAGPLWLSDLTAVDPYYITPILYVGLQMIILRLNLPMQSGIIGDMKNVSKVSWVFLGCYAAALGALCTQFPAAISTIWLYSMSFTAISNAAMYLPAVRRRLGIPTSLPTTRPGHLPPIQESPVKEIMNKELFKASKQE